MSAAISLVTDIIITERV